MFKELLIIRHAKSDWDNLNLRDFDRPLNKRGHRSAPEMAKRLVNQQIKPGLIVSSPALRAITTAKYFAEAWSISEEDIVQESSIYEASRGTLLNLINGFDEQFNKIAVFGHNPGLTDLINYLDGHIYEMPTCGVCYMQFPFESWAEISEATAKVLLFDYPKSEDH